jgi:hypothetical protein
VGDYGIFRAASPLEEAQSWRLNICRSIPRLTVASHEKKSVFANDTLKADNYSRGVKSDRSPCISTWPAEPVAHTSTKNVAQKSGQNKKILPGQENALPLLVIGWLSFLAF